jgi:hypothetical protein
MFVKLLVMGGMVAGGWLLLGGAIQKALGELIEKDKPEKDRPISTVIALVLVSMLALFIADMIV